MNFKQTILSLCFLLSSNLMFPQASGNINYGRIPLDAGPYTPAALKIPGSTLDASFQSPYDITFTVRGLYNVKADSYTAIFTMTQAAKTQSEVNSIINGKIEAIKGQIDAVGEDVDLFVDMISFMPLYEVVTEKKLFSKKTYNEIPKGFELKKNLHFSFKNQALLNFLVTICSEQEIYDLVRVDYVVDNMETRKNEILNKANIDINKKMNRYKTLLKKDYSDMERMVAENFEIHYPVEQYNQYQAYCSNSLSFSTQKVNSANKKTSSFYTPLLNKNFDIVVNPNITEPLVQIEYVIKIRLTPKPKKVVKEVKPIVKVETKVVKDIFIVTPDAKVQKLNIP